MRAKDDLQARLDPQHFPQPRTWPSAVLSLELSGGRPFPPKAARRISNGKEKVITSIQFTEEFGENSWEMAAVVQKVEKKVNYVG